MIGHSWCALGGDVLFKMEVVESKQLDDGRGAFLYSFDGKAQGVEAAVNCSGNENWC
jgi:hypothetical protein